MYGFGVNRSWLFRSGGVLLLLVCANGCGRQKDFVKIPCGEVSVDVDPTIGANPPAVYVCANHTVTWKHNGHHFKVEFKQESPFIDGGKVFDNGHSQSAAMNHYDRPTVFEYRITVDNGKPIDPQVIGGGGN